MALHAIVSRQIGKSAGSMSEDGNGNADWDPLGITSPLSSLGSTEFPCSTRFEELESYAQNK